MTFLKETLSYSPVSMALLRLATYEMLFMEDIPKKTDYIFVVYSKDLMKMPFVEVEKLLGELVAEAKVCYNKQNG